MAIVARLRAKRRAARKGRKRQRRLFRRTGDVGHRERAGVLGLRARKLTGLLKRALSIAPGPPAWGGSKRVLLERSESIARRHGLEPTSGKRRDTFGNPGSDHFVGNLLSFARDWRLARGGSLAEQEAAYSAAAEETRKACTPDRSHQDYEHFYFEDNGHTYRGQLIAANHGTGPHLHFGVERVD